MRYASIADKAGEIIYTGWYELNPFPGNSQVVVSNHAFIHPQYRKQGYGRTQHQERLKVAKRLGYSYIICTVSKENEAELHILEKEGWANLDAFWNPTSNHLVGIFGKNL